MISYEVTLSDEDGAKLAAMSDKAGVINDLEFLDNKIQEWINEDARLTHTEK